MKTDLRGISVITRTLSSGETKVYYYFGRSRKAKRPRGEPDSLEFLESYKAAAEKKRAGDDVTENLIDDHRGDEETKEGRACPGGSNSAFPLSKTDGLERTIILGPTNALGDARKAPDEAARSKGAPRNSRWPPPG